MKLCGRQQMRKRRNNGQGMETVGKEASQRAHPQHPLVLQCIQQVHGLWLVVLFLEM